jgi:hypothetical protein
VHVARDEHHEETSVCQNLETWLVSSLQDDGCVYCYAHRHPMKLSSFAILTISDISSEVTLNSCCVALYPKDTYVPLPFVLLNRPRIQLFVENRRRPNCHVDAPFHCWYRLLRLWVQAYIMAYITFLTLKSPSPIEADCAQSPGDWKRALSIYMHSISIPMFWPFPRLFLIMIFTTCEEKPGIDHYVLHT